MTNTELYHIDDIIASCNACGAYTLSRDPSHIKHYPGCGGLREVKKWDDCYSSPERQEAAKEDS